MKPGVSSSLLSRFFQTSSKSWAFSGFTCIGKYEKLGRADRRWTSQLTTQIIMHMPSDGRRLYLEVVLCDKEEVGGHRALHKSTIRSLHVQMRRRPDFGTSNFANLSSNYKEVLRYAYLSRN